jgi:hypothetical protein
LRHWLLRHWHHDPSASRTLAASCSSVNGLVISCTPLSSTPLWMMALLV